MSLLLLTGGRRDVRRRGGRPAAGLFAATMIGLALACGGASALNHVLDRDIDKLMGRAPSSARSRPAACRPSARSSSGSRSRRSPSSSSRARQPARRRSLALAGNLFYVLVYTRWLKRSTPQNIVIGGAAGAVPPLVGYAAATGQPRLPALWLFLIVFFWTPPHFWALALLIKEHYARPACRCCPWSAATRRRRGRSSATRLLVVASRSCRRPRHRSGSSTVAAASCSARVFLGLALELRRTPTRRTRASSSTTRSSTSRCSSWPWPLDPMLC